MAMCARHGRAEASPRGGRGERPRLGEQLPIYHPLSVVTQQLKAERSALDLGPPALGRRCFASVGSEIATRAFRYLMVRKFQDTNGLQLG
jgi:hypothetical protein